jgi:pimeloyl-ACP methyl ester carboxylesterase
MSAVTSASETSRTPLSLVFVHGFLDNRTVWSPLMEQFESTSYVHYTLDLRGAGTLREDGGPYTLAQAAADVERLIAELAAIEAFLSECALPFPQMAPLMASSCNKRI